MEVSAERSHVTSSVDASGGKIERQLFIPFLEKLLDADEIKGLEWLSNEKRVFRMPWKHMKRHDYDLERDSMLFKAWAVNSGKFKETEQDPSRWKINFRSALNTMKHVLVEEESSDEDCRVFRIVETPAPQQRKRRCGEMLGADAYSISGYGNAPNAKQCPLKTEQERPASTQPSATTVHQYPWQPTQYVYPAPAMGTPMPMSAASHQPVTYITTVDGTQNGPAYYLPNRGAYAQPQAMAGTHPHTIMHSQQYGVAHPVAPYPGYVPTGHPPAQQANGVMVRPASHPLAVPASGHPMVPVRQDQMVHMLSPQSLKTNNSCESLASAQSTTVAPSTTAVATSSACSLNDQFHGTTVDGATQSNAMKHNKTTPLSRVGSSDPKPKSSGYSSKKTGQKFFGSKTSWSNSTHPHHNKPSFSAKEEDEEVDEARHTPADKNTQDAADDDDMDHEDDDVIVDVTSYASSSCEGDDNAAHRQGNAIQQQHHLQECTDGNNASRESQADAEQQRLHGQELAAVQVKVDESKRHLEQLEGSLAERNARIVQMEMQREQLNVCLHREWLIIKDLVSMVTANKTQMEQYTLQLSHLRNPASGTSSNVAHSKKHTENNNEHEPQHTSHKKSKKAAKAATASS